MHAHHIKQIPPYHRNRIKNWATGQIADNCRSNMKISEVLGIPTIGCQSQEMNLAASCMCMQDETLNGMITKIESAMTDFQGKL